jgi:hypothetical protein
MTTPVRYIANPVLLQTLAGEATGPRKESPLRVPLQAISGLAFRSTMRSVAFRACLKFTYQVTALQTGLQTGMLGNTNFE